jgi:hypothetical protein
MARTGCNDCGAKFGGAPFVHHENDGGLGGPWCMRCAVLEHGFGEPTARHENYVIHE